MNTLTRHTATEACAGQHCYAHGVDEPAGPDDVACYECGHVHRDVRAHIESCEGCGHDL